jgi:transposase-like protein
MIKNKGPTDTEVKTLFKKLGKMRCPNCNETGEIGYSFVHKKWDCNDCGHTWQ